VADDFTSQHNHSNFSDIACKQLCECRLFCCAMGRLSRMEDSTAMQNKRHVVVQRPPVRGASAYAQHAGWLVAPRGIGVSYRDEGYSEPWTTLGLLAVKIDSGRE